MEDRGDATLLLEIRPAFIRGCVRSLQFISDLNLKAGQNRDVQHDCQPTQTADPSTPLRSGRDDILQLGI
jgi:hypothetical protein